MGISNRSSAYLFLTSKFDDIFDKIRQKQGKTNQKQGKTSQKQGKTSQKQDKTNQNKPILTIFFS